MVSMKGIIGSHDIVLITLDTLRYDVAQKAFENGLTPGFAKYLPNSGWELRHSPASFTFAAHQAFFSGFLPTPAKPGIHSRLFAAEFIGSESATSETFCFPESNLISALRRLDYHTICIGGVGFFNKQTDLGSVLPNLFDESHWAPELSVTNPESTRNQVFLAQKRLQESRQPTFLFINISAIHQPNCHYLSDSASRDSLESHSAALRYVDESLKPLWSSLEKRRPGLCILCSDHGTAYGEDGYEGHRIGHQTVWNVPYAEFIYGGSGNTTE